MLTGASKAPETVNQTAIMLRAKVTQESNGMMDVGHGRTATLGCQISEHAANRQTSP